MRKLFTVKAGGFRPRPSNVLLILVVGLAGLLCGFTINNRSSGFELSKQELLLRNIGHELLLRSGDKHSRVMPVRKLSSTEYQIRFENDFEFSTDSLVNISKRSLAGNKLSNDYIVNVVTCSTSEVIFGYSIISDLKTDIVPCLGRVQPKGCYLINVIFQPKSFWQNASLYLFVLIPILGLSGMLFFMPGKRTRVVFSNDGGGMVGSTFQNVGNSELLDGAENARGVGGAYGFENTIGINLGATTFDFAERRFSANGVSVELTSKETKLLSIFVSAPNILIERARLQKEIWEDEGVIVSRSLDMYISRLRKKLEIDPSLKLVNIPRRGYRLESASV